LEEYLIHQTELSKTDQNGIAIRDHYKQVERQTGKRPKELDGPEFPRKASHLWSAFLDLSNTRQQGMSGPLPISYLEIKTYCELYGIELDPVDVDAIKRLDNAFLRTANNG
jgi:hypothetical protein